MSWELIDHVCAACFGRLLARNGVYRCSNCGAAADVLKSVCACGIRLNAGKGKTKDAGIRCVKNKHISPEFPGEIVAEQVN